jgi:prolyl-tRNA synthetase
VPAEADIISHQLLLKAGMIHQVATGVYSYLPLGWRVLRKVEQVIREEMERIGGQELRMSVLQPREIWEVTGRHLAFGPTMFSLTDRRDRQLFLGPTHEEIITELVRHNVRSYRDLPLLLYQIQTKFRDELRPRGGLLRVREFNMKDLYSFDTDEDSLDQSYNKVIQAYKNIYSRLGLPAILVEADSGAIGGKASHEFMTITESGEDEIIYCDHCQYAANVEKAQSIKPQVKSEAPLPVEEVATPGIGAINELASFLGVAPSQTLKAVFYAANGELVFVIIRGDLEVNEVKLGNALKCSQLRLATEEEVGKAGLIAGAASPVGISGIKRVADNSITLGGNFVAGANKPDTHLKNVNYPRDFEVDLLADIATARAGEGCPGCGAKLLSTRGIEVGHIFKLGTFLSEKLEASFQDQEGVPHPIIMGCYGIGLGRLLAAAVELSHDAQGIIWPPSMAPYYIYLCPLHLENPEVASTAERLYSQLEAEGLEPLFDDRDESPGVKFNDADLLGIPLRVTVSPRTLKSHSIEVKQRAKNESHLLPLEGIATKLRQLKGDL